MASDLEIARAAKLLPIEDIARDAGFEPQTVSPYGRYIAKIDPRPYAELPQRARLVLVTAINPTPAGEGKTTMSIALADGMRLLGKRVMLALREPSLGPVFGMKGGATGGGYSQVVPMESINLHFTGDLHAITAANNLLCAMIDNHIHQGNALGIDPRRVCFRHCLDVNDRQLRHIVQGIGGVQNGVPREDGFDITAASEVMAAFCLASDLSDLKARLGRMVAAHTYQGKPVTASDLGAAGAMTALLRDAFSPNLVQTLGHTPCLMHGGPFANIAHGCNSVAATRLALKMADFAVTEAGFGADLGAEKFLDIKCRMNGLWPSVVVLVATLRALKHHGGVPKGEYGAPNAAALEKGMANLLRHVQNITEVWRTPVVVALNRFDSDAPEELRLVSEALSAHGVALACCTGWADGGQGATELAELVCEVAQRSTAQPSYTYPDDASLTEKLEILARRVYHAGAVSFTQQARKDLAQLEAEGYGACPVCVAKTQYSMSDDASLLGAPEGYTLTIRSARLSAGAGFVVAFAGSIIAMPGLPKAPAALGIDVTPEGEIVGLF
ncbi:MAG TPA: formate--tetrahydrofolate ligase [Candidatus Limiplasma stercoravium]|nr:formate--tetrahydrofolate ligase [Candidatus Limiplasma stercoravium]